MTDSDFATISCLSSISTCMSSQLLLYYLSIVFCLLEAVTIIHNFIIHVRNIL